MSRALGKSLAPRAVESTNRKGKKRSFAFITERVGLFFADRQAFDQLVVFMKLDRMIFPLGYRNDQGTGKTSRVAFLARRLIPQTQDSALLGHGGNFVGTKSLAPPDGGQDQLGLESAGREAWRFVPNYEGYAKDLVELLLVIQGHEGSGGIGLELIGYFALIAKRLTSLSFS